MPQLFHPSMKVIARVSLVAVPLVLAGLTWAASTLYRAGYTTNVSLPIEQPIPFSHKHHVHDVGLTCRYCHTSVDRTRFAGIPPTNTCMTCHSQIWTTSPMLEPVRESYRTGKPLEWIRVNDLPDFVYFNHSMHIDKGIGCETCHGRIDLEPLTIKAQTLYMSWCLDCHRAPEKYIRPRTEVYNMEYVPPADQLALGRKLVKEYDVQVNRITDCSTCHR